MSNERPAGAKLRVAVFVSGGGTNLQALLDAERTSPYEIVLVAADRDCFALKRAQKAGKPAKIARKPEGLTGDEARLAVSDALLSLCAEFGVEAIVLAGFLTIMKGRIIAKFANKVINIHPSLLPKFGGKGMWGHHVHEAVLAAGEAESGCSVHLVDSGCDTGEVLLQRRVAVKKDDTAESLAARILPEEYIAIVEGTAMLARRILS